MGVCSTCGAKMFKIGGVAPIPNSPVAQVAKVVSTQQNKTQQSVDVRKPDFVNVDPTPFTTKINFKRVKCLIGPMIGNVLFVVHQKVVNVKSEKFTLGGNTYDVALEETAYVAKTFLRGAMPHLLYNINNAYPISPSTVVRINASSKSFNVMFKRNIVQQGLAALRSTTAAPIAMLIIVGVICGLLGYFAGVAFPANGGSHVAASTTTNTFHTITATGGAILSRIGRLAGGGA